MARYAIHPLPPNCVRLSRILLAYLAAYFNGVAATPHIIHGDMMERAMLASGMVMPFAGPSQTGGAARFGAGAVVECCWLPARRRRRLACFAHADAAGANARRRTARPRLTPPFSTLAARARRAHQRYAGRAVRQRLGARAHGGCGGAGAVCVHELQAPGQ